MEEVGLPPLPGRTDAAERLAQLCAAQRAGTEAVKDLLENALGITRRSLAALQRQEMDDNQWTKDSAFVGFGHCPHGCALSDTASSKHEETQFLKPPSADHHGLHHGDAVLAAVWRVPSPPGEEPKRTSGRLCRNQSGTAASAISASYSSIGSVEQKHKTVPVFSLDAELVLDKWASMAEKLLLMQHTGSRGTTASKCLRPVWGGSAEPTAAPKSRKYFCLGAVDAGIDDTLNHGTSLALPSRGVEAKLQCLVINPSSLWRLLWELIGFLLLMFDMITLPLEVFDYGETDMGEVLRYVISTFWLLDMTMSFFSGYMEDGVPEVRLWNVWRHYLRGWFVLDLIIVSVDWALLLADIATSTLALPRTFKVGRFIRVVRLLRFARFWHMLQSQAHSHRKNVIGTFLTQFLNTFFGSFCLLLLPVFFSHIVACAWYWVGTNMNDGENKRSWLDMIDSDTINSKVALYWLCFHWAISQYTPAPNSVHPVTLPERVFAVVTLLIGFIVFSCFLGTVTSMVTAARLSTQKKLEEESQIVRFLREHRVSFNLSHHVVSLTKQQRVRKTLLGEEDITCLKALPEIIRVRLHHEVYSRYLQKHSLFEWVGRRDRSMLAQLAHYAVKSASYSRLSEIFIFGQPSNQMFFVMDGHINYKAGYKNRRAFTSIHAGQTLSEPALWMDWLHQGYADAYTDCSIFTVKADAFCEVVSADRLIFQSCKIYALGYVEKLGALFGVDVYFHIKHQESGFKIPKIDDIGLQGRDVDHIIGALSSEAETSETGNLSMAPSTRMVSQAFSGLVAPWLR